MRPGDLVEIKRASIGIPAGTIALIIECHNKLTGVDSIYTVWPTGEAGKRGERRYLARDLAVIDGPSKSKLRPQTTLKTS